jgi:hypothetical protein
MKKLLLLNVFVFYILISCDKELREEIYEGNLILNFQSEVNQLKNKRIIQVTGDLIVERFWDYKNSKYLTDIVDLSPLMSIKKVDGDLKIIWIETVENLDFLANVNEIGGELGLYQNTNLQNINSLGKLKSVGEVIIRNNYKLIDINALSTISILDGGFVFESNYLVKNFPELTNIKELKGDLIINNNPNLESLSGFSNLTNVVGDLKILDYQNGLVNLNGLNNLKEIGKTLMIGNIGEGGNKTLLNLTGLEKLEIIGGSLYLIECHNLTDLSALIGLQEIGEELNIDGNEKIESLEGLDNVKRTNSIFIARNIELDDFCAIKDLVETTNFDLNEFKIFLNKSNPTIEQLITAGCQ